MDYTAVKKSAHSMHFGMDSLLVVFGFKEEFNVGKNGNSELIVLPSEITLCIGTICSRRDTFQKQWLI